MPAEARQTVLVPDRVSTGQAALVPVQFSAGSQMPAAGGQTVLVAAKGSPGQLALVPVQVSCGSQMPADARQTVPPATKAQLAVQQLPAVPLPAPLSHDSRPKFASKTASPQVERSEERRVGE